jgi:hypothetical protein
MCATHCKRRCGATTASTWTDSAFLLPSPLFPNFQRKRSISKQLFSYFWRSSRPSDCAHHGISVAFLLTRLSLSGLSLIRCLPSSITHRTMALDLCEVCRTIFREPPILDTDNPHHQSPDDFIKAAANCYICRKITKSDTWKGV